MHNNFYFLRQLSSALESALSGAVVSECFSQSKDELVLRFETMDQPFLIRASLAPELSCLSFPDVFQRARKNSVDLFPELAGRRVTGIRQFNNERSFSIAFSGGYILLFKMHGNRTNLVLFHNGAPIQRFRNSIDADSELDLQTLDRDIDWSHDAFVQHAHDLKRLYFTFGKRVWRYLTDQQFFDATPAEQWESVQTLRAHLNHPSHYYITIIDGKPALSLVETGDIKEVLPHPIAAANAYYHAFIHDYAFDRERHSALAALRAKVNAGEAYAEKNATRLAALQRDLPYKVWADLIMANLHRIPKDTEEISLENFYAGNRPEKIKLKRLLSPQKNAELYYRKARNQHIEIEQLTNSIAQKQQELQALQEKITAIESATDLKTLRSRTSGIQQKSGRQPETLPFHEFEFSGYKIWVGRNAQSNDTLTLKSSYKDDLWLHAKDVAGSHVLIKHQAGKNFPKDVIAYAASLAAHYSKRKNEGLVPVIVTPKKFVRKRKGDPAGAVVVERETVVMAEPRRFP